MKKRRSIIILSAVMLLLIVGAVSVFLLTNREQTTQTGNKANIDWYTEDGKEFVITTVDELYGLVKLSQYYNFSGQTIKLGADIVVNEGSAEDWAKKAPKKKWFPIDGFAGKFDGQGHTISGIYGYGADTVAGLFSNTKTKANIKDFKLVNSYFKVDGSSPVGSIVSNGCGTLEKIYSNAIVTSNGENAGGIVGQANDDGTASAMAKTMKIVNCWFDGSLSLTTKTGRYGGGIVGLVSGGTLTVSHCLNSGNISSQSTESNGLYVGGLFGALTYANYSGAVVLEDSLNVGKVETLKTTATGSIAGSKASDVTWKITDTYTTEQSNASICTKQSGTTEGGVPQMNTDFVKGTEWYRWTTLDFDTYWAVTEDSTPVLKCFADEVIDTSRLTKAYNLNWYIEGRLEQVLSTKEDLYGFALLSYSKTFEGQNIVLGNDIVVNEGKASNWAKGKNAPTDCWIPIGRSLAFQGTFDGKGYTVSGLYGTTTVSFMGLFGWVGNYGEIKNVSVKNSYFESVEASSAAVGSIAGRLEGKIDTAYSDAIISGTGALLGGIAGYKRTNVESKISNCWYDGTINMVGDKGKYVGGIIGRLIDGTIEIDNCLFSGKINIGGIRRTVSVGGFIGVISAGNVVVNGCLNSGEFEVTEAEKVNAVGRAFGQLADSEAINITVTSSYFTNVGYNGDYYYYRQGDKQTIKGGAELKEIKNISGHNGYRTTDLDFNKYWAIVVNEDGTPILKSFAKKVPSVAGLEKTFDKSWYDPDKNTYTLKDKKDLYGFSYLSNSKIDFKGKTIVLANDIQVHAGSAVDWSNNTNTPEDIYNWDGIGKYTAFFGNFDGQGHTISGLYGVTDTVNIGLFASVGADGIVQNLRLTNTYFGSTKTGSAAVGSVAGRLEGSVHGVYSDAILTSIGNNNGGIVGYKNGDTESKITNCWFAGSITMGGDTTNATGGIVGRHYAGPLEIGNCLFSGELAVAGIKRSSNTGGFVGRAEGNLTIDGCLNSGILRVVDVAKMDSMGRVIGQIKNDEATSVVMKNTYFTMEGYNPTNYWYCAGDKPTIERGAELKSRESIMGYGGYQTTSLDFDKYWTVVVNENGTPILKSFTDNVPSVAGLEKTFDKSWYNPKESTYILENKQDLYGFAYLSNSKIDFSGKTIVLANDILKVNTGTASEWSNGTNIPDIIYNWDGIGKYTSFEGCFDGQGHTISGLYGITDTTHIGLFASVATKGVIKNVSLKDTYFENKATGSAGVGSIAGRCEGSVHSAYSDAILKSSGNNNGGIVGYKNEATKSSITNCWYAGTMKVTGNASGGIVGRLYAGTLNMSDCLFSGTLSVGGEKRSVSTGGLVGRVADKLTLDGCLNSGILEVAEASKMDSLGRVIGQITNDKSTDVAMKNTYFTNKGDNATTYWYCAGKLPTIEYGAELKDEKTVMGYGGFDTTSLDFENAWVVVLDDEATPNINEAGTPVLKKFAQKAPSVAGRQKIFDKSWYDAKKDKYYIENKEDLYGLVYLSNSKVDFEGKTIILKKDILHVNEGSAMDWSNGIKVPGTVYNWDGVGKYTPFYGEFDGQGHTISGLYGVTDTTHIGLFASVDEKGSVHNLRLTNSCFEITKTGSAGIGSIAGLCEGDVYDIYSDAILKSNGNNNGGIIGYKNENTESKITNCWYAGTLNVSSNASGGIIGRIYAGDVNLDTCLFSGKISINGDNRSAIGGFVGRVDQSVTIKNSLNSGEFELIETETADSTGRIIGLVNNTKSVSMTLENVYFTDKGFNGTNEWYCSGTNPTISSDYVQVAENDAKGYLAYFNTSLDFGKDWAIVLDDESTAEIDELGAPVLKKFADTTPAIPQTPENVDINWYSYEKDTYTLSEAEDLRGLSYLSGYGLTFAGKTVALERDIDLNKNKGTVAEWEAKDFKGVEPWTPIGTMTTKFAGVFDGKLHSIEGLYVDSSEQGVGLFRSTATGSTIKNLKIMNSYFRTSAAFAGSVVGACGGNLHNVYSSAKVVSTTNYSGGLVGQIWNAGEDAVSISQCWYAGQMEVYRNTGGIVGIVSCGKVEMSNCLNTGTIAYDTGSGNDKYVGGLCGRTLDFTEEWSTTAGDGTNSTIDLKISNCLVTGTLSTSSKNYVGSIIGRPQRTPVTYENVYFTNESYAIAVGKTSTTNPATTGITGYSLSQITVSDGGNTESDVQNKLTGFDFANVWAFGVDGTPELLWVNNLNIDINWYNDSKDVYQIGTPKELYGLAYLCNQGNNFAGKTIELTKNIDLNEGKGTVAEWEVKDFEGVKSWTPIGTTTTKFAGVFDGKNYTIEGIYVNSNEMGVGLFRSTATGSTIKNLKIKDSYFKTSAAFGGSVVGVCGGNLQNVYSSAKVVSTTNYSGGLVGQIWNAGEDAVSISQCWYAGQMEVYRNTGGIVGIVSCGKVEMSNCLNTGTIAYDTGSGNDKYVGGLCGRTLDFTGEWSTTAGTGTNSTIDLKISNCLVTGTLSTSSKNYVGAIIGRPQRTPVTYENVYFTNESYAIAVGKTSTTNPATTGITGYSLSQITVSEGGNTESIVRSRLIGFDFTNVWTIGTEGTPELVLQAPVSQ